MVRIHLVHFSVQVTTWWWYESSHDLIGAEGICMGLIEIIALVGRWKLIHLLFRHHLSVLPVVLSNPPVKLIFGGVSALGIIYYSHYHQFFIHWRLKILIWCNYQLIFVSVHSRTNLFAEIQVISFHTITDYICVNHYHGFILYFSSFDVFTLHIKFDH